jgi:hypothetical protein
MKYLILTLAFSAAIPLALTSCGKTSVASEKPAAAAAESSDSFLAAYRKAHEAKDKTALDAFLYNEGTPAEIMEFFKMMRDASLEGKGTVELKTPSAEDATKFNQAMEMPDGKYYKLPLTPSHQLVITVETKDGESTSKSTSSLPVAQKNGKFVIPLPVPTGQAAAQ